VIRLALALAFTLAASSGAAAASLPRNGVLVPGTSLAGVRLGDTPSTVRTRWGTRFRTCDRCAERTWYYTSGQATGVAVSFRNGRASTVFTLGSPHGWRTREGLRLGDGIDRVNGLYRGLAWKTCIGYVAMSMRRSGVVTSIYATGESVYGFALTRPGEPICQ
jgi:hypothetical protein